MDAYFGNRMYCPFCFLDAKPVSKVWRGDVHYCCAGCGKKIGEPVDDEPDGIWPPMTDEGEDTGGGHRVTRPNLDDYEGTNEGDDD